MKRFEKQKLQSQELSWKEIMGSLQIGLFGNENIFIAFHVICFESENVFFLLFIFKGRSGFRSLQTGQPSPAAVI